MLQRTNATALPALLAVALLLSPAAIAAPESPAQETPPAQVQPDDHSYLPPWMQPQASGASAAQPTLEAQYLNALGDPIAKPNPPQRPPQKRRSNAWFGIFGR